MPALPQKSCLTQNNSKLTQEVKYSRFLGSRVCQVPIEGMADRSCLVWLLTQSGLENIALNRPR